MKISQKQAGLLAKEVFKQLQKEKTFAVSEVLKTELKAWITERKKLTAVVTEAEEQVRKHESELRKITGNIGRNRIEPYYDLNRMIENLEKQNTPSVSTIEDEIILSAMFNTETDMQTFIDKVAKKFAKKNQLKILQN